MMPMPIFLGLLTAVIATAGLTIWLAYALGLPMTALGLLALLAAGALRLWMRKP